MLKVQQINAKFKKS